MTVPGTGQSVKMTNNGTGFVSPIPGYAETVVLLEGSMSYQQKMVIKQLSHFMKLYVMIQLLSKELEL